MQQALLPAHPLQPAGAAVRLGAGRTLAEDAAAQSQSDDDVPLQAGLLQQHRFNEVEHANSVARRINVHYGTTHTDLLDDSVQYAIGNAFPPQQQQQQQAFDGHPQDADTFQLGDVNVRETNVNVLETTPTNGGTGEQNVSYFFL